MKTTCRERANKKHCEHELFATINLLLFGCTNMLSMLEEMTVIQT